MKQCKQLEKFYTEYVCDLLDEEQTDRIEEHLARLLYLHPRS